MGKGIEQRPIEMEMKEIKNGGSENCKDGSSVSVSDTKRSQIYDLAPSHSKQYTSFLPYGLSENRAVTIYKFG